MKNVLTRRMVKNWKRVIHDCTCIEVHIVLYRNLARFYCTNLSILLFPPRAIR